jgi:hypothetical protein
MKRPGSDERVGGKGGAPLVFLCNNRGKRAAGYRRVSGIARWFRNSGERAGVSP